jgi:MerR family transcriptional regulator/heat shock protein HspR
MAARRKKSGDVEPTRGVYMISVAAELASMHPQTLRIYESRGLITPERSPKGTRLYSQDDVDRLRRIQELTTELGMNLAGVERVFELELELEKMRRRMERLEREAQTMQLKLRDELDRVRKSFKAELVPYTGARRRDLVPAQAHGSGARRFVVPITRATQDDGRA